MDQDFEVIIIGGSYAGLSAALSLGRSNRKILILDSGLPCNRQTPNSHNYLTRDKTPPAELNAIAIDEVLTYPSVSFARDKATAAVLTETGFAITTASGMTHATTNILFATGMFDIMPDIGGFAECWGISVVHCPYCHGYEFMGQKTAILANGEQAWHYAMLLKQLTNDITLLTDGKADLNGEQFEKLAAAGIPVMEGKVKEIVHTHGYASEVLLEDATRLSFGAIYSKPAQRQHCGLPETLGCKFDENGFIAVDVMQKTSVPGIYAAGDCTSPMRSVANAVAGGSKAGAMINFGLCSTAF